jgi:hypothetical protein
MNELPWFGLKVRSRSAAASFAKYEAAANVKLAAAPPINC